VKVLFVVSGNVRPMPFIEEQRLSLQSKGCEVDYFFIKGRGVFGYLKNFRLLKPLAVNGDYDIIHAHYGLAGLLAVIQRKVPVVITFHGSDINNKTNRVLSFIASRFSKHNVFVNKKMPRMILAGTNFSVIPCGVDMRVFHHVDIREARSRLGLNLEKKYVLFSSSFDNPVKNCDLARAAISTVKEEVALLELKGFSRSEVNYMLNACNLLLMTSFSEGSPQVIKEALACGTPIVSTRVGDVPDLVNGISGCYLANSESFDLGAKIETALASPERSSGRNAIVHLSLDAVAAELRNIYSRICLS